MASRPATFGRAPLLGFVLTSEGESKRMKKEKGVDPDRLFAQLEENEVMLIYL